MLLQLCITMGFQLAPEVCSQGISFRGWPTWNGLWSQISCLSLLFRIAFDRGARNAKKMNDFFAWAAFFDGAHHSFSEIC